MSHAFARGLWVCNIVPEVGHALRSMHDENSHAPAAADGAGVSSGAEAEQNDCIFSKVGGNQPGAPSVGAALPVEDGFDVRD